MYARSQFILIHPISNDQRTIDIECKKKKFCISQSGRRRGTGRNILVPELPVEPAKGPLHRC
jgi:hypothetical protein